MGSSEWLERKMTIDVVYTLSAILSETLGPYVGEIVEVLNNLRYDKFKQVREAALEAY